jgi:hypothetical protein
MLFEIRFSLPAFKSGRSLFNAADQSVPGDKTHNYKKAEGRRMSDNVSRRSLLALGAGLGATMVGGGALARAPKLGTQSPYFHRFIMGSAEVTVVSDGPLPLGDPSSSFVGVPKDEVKKMLADNFLSADNVVLEQNSPILSTFL